MASDTAVALASERRAYAGRLQRWLAQAEAREAALEAELARLERSRRARLALERMDADRPRALGAEQGRAKGCPGDSATTARSGKCAASSRTDKTPEPPPIPPEARAKLVHSRSLPAAAPPPLPLAPPRTPPPPPPQSPRPPPHLPRGPPYPLPLLSSHLHARHQAHAAASLIAGLQFALDAERAAHRQLASDYARLAGAHAALQASHAQLQQRADELQARNVALWALADG